MHDVIGEAMPIDESYYGEIFVTIPNFTHKALTYKRSEFIVAICSRVLPLELEVQEDNFCTFPSKPHCHFPQERGIRNSDPRWGIRKRDRKDPFL